MQISKLERFLMIDVGYFVKKYLFKMLGSPFSFISIYFSDFDVLYANMDVWAFEDDGFEDNQLSLLGLNIDLINNEDSYWKYDHTKRGRSRHWSS